MAFLTTKKNRSGPLPKRFFSRHNPKAPMSSHHLRINRMKPFSGDKPLKPAGKLVFFNGFDILCREKAHFGRLG